MFTECVTAPSRTSATLAIDAGLRGVDLERQPVVRDGGRGVDHGPVGELARAVGLEEVRRREDLRVLGQVADLVAGAADAAARGQDAPVREQQRGRVVLAGDRLGRERRPRAGRRVPALGGVDAVGEVHEARAGRVAAGREHAAVREHGEVVLAAPVRHRRGLRDRRRGAVDVDHARVAARAAAARDEDLADVVERVAAVAAVDRVARALRLPGAGAVRVEAAHRRVRARDERAPVRRHVGPRVQRLAQRGGAQRPQARRTSCAPRARSGRPR